MISRETILDYALSLPGAASDQPFDEDFDSTVLRHRASGKWFGLIIKAPRRKIGLEGDGESDVLNLKCDPVVAYGLTQTVPDIIPAWHMNKHHWISIRLEGDVPRDQLEALIDLSYCLTGGHLS